MRTKYLNIINLIGLTLFVCYNVSGQASLSGQVVDSVSGEALIYCHVSVKNSAHGTITNDDGVFSLDDVSLSDSLMLSYVGYRVAVVSVAEVRRERVIELVPMFTPLGELTVYADDDFLYEAIFRCSRAMQDQPVLEARTYFNLETLEDTEPLEMIESYYNTKLRGASLLTMDLKNGRVGWPVQNDGHYFVNLNTTKALAMLDLFNPNAAFPLNPMQYKPGKMKKYYTLVRLPSLSDTSVIHISFEPRKSPGEYFRGEIWLDRASFRLLKLNLEIDDAKLHPFEPLNKNSMIESIDFNISYNFSGLNTGYHLDNMNFSYDINLLHDWATIRQPVQVSTQGLIYFYDYREPFILPFFDYDPEHDDYRKISFMPYDSMFWARDREFIPGKSQLKRLAFLEQQGVLLNFKKDFVVEATGENYGFFEQSNIQWSRDNRVHFKIKREEGESIDVPGESFEVPALNSDKFRIKVKLFLDVNKYADDYRYTSSAVLDVFESSNRQAESHLIDCITNICLDLGEIERRKMISALNASKYSENEIGDIYRKSEKDLEARIQFFLRETQLGINMEKLSNWNSLVRAQLGIDNMDLFNIIQE